MQINRFYFICSVVQRCVPKNITSVIDLAKENGVDLTWNSTVINSLPNAVKNIEFIAEVESVSSKRSSISLPLDAAERLILTRPSNNPTQRLEKNGSISIQSTQG